MSKYPTRETPNVVIIEKLTPFTRGLVPGKVYYDKDEAWKLDVGAECNRLLEHAANMETEPTSDYGRSAAADIRSIVARVAEFEELEKGC